MFSYSGQGEVPFFIFVAIWSYKWNNKSSWEARTFINFMVMCYLWTSFHMYALKSLFHGSRPYLEDISLADSTIMETCSAEFGSPSGHSILATQGFLQVFWYFSKSKKGLFMVLLWTLGIQYSRVYLGRHTFDQVILGGYIGVVNAYFLEFYAKKRYEATLNISVY